MKTAIHSDRLGTGPARRRDKRTPEFMIYFLFIFVFALPFATVDWVAQALKRQTLNLHGPLARAWAEADRVTPFIFMR